MNRISNRIFVVKKIKVVYKSNIVTITKTIYNMLKKVWLTGHLIYKLSQNFESKLASNTFQIHWPKSYQASRL